MANLTQVELPNGTTYDIQDAYKSGIYTVIGTQTAATGSWTGDLHGVSALYDGLTIMYYLPWAGSGNATLNLTLDGGTTTGAVNCYYGNTTRLTTHYSKGSNIVMTYWSAGSIKIDGTATTDNRWIANANYADGNTKNTAGSTDTSSKIFLVGATSQAANPQTYSHDTVYVGTDGHAYSNSKQVVNLSDTQALTNKTYNGYTLGTSCAKDIPSSGNASTTQVVMGNDTRLSDARTPTSHTHGNIQNGGTLQTNDITIASGDKIVVTDSSDSAKVARTSISFDGSTATKALTQKGTWETFGTSNLTIGTTSTTALKGDTKYAGSSSAGGAATSANKINTDGGSMLNPVYFSSGVPVASSGNTIPFIVGTGSTAGTWLGSLTGLTAYYDGLLILYKPSVAGATTTTLNINSLGAKTCYINNTTKLTTHFPANQPILLAYSTSQNSGCWMCIDDYWTNSNTIPSAYCGTAAATAAKTASCDYYVATAKSYTHIDIRYANTSASAITLNINSQGAKPIYINGTASSASNYTLPAGTYLIYYDGTNYYFRTDGKLTANITGDAGTVNGLTVQTAVPANAKFTDDAVTQSLLSANGNYPILMSYADSSSTTTDVTKICYRNNSVYVNPSTGNIQATQLNGVTIGSSPKFTDTNNAVTQTATSTNADYEVLFSSTADNTTRTESARKNNNLTFNPSNGQLTATSLRVNGSSGTNGVTVNNGILLKNSTFTNDIATFRADYNSGGGCLKLNNSDGSGESVAIYSDSNNSGNIWLSRSDASTADKSRVQIGSSNGGAIYLKDNSANATIGITGFNGNINCKTINSHAVPKMDFATTQLTFTSSTTMVYLGKSVTCPSGARMLVRAYFRYVNGGPVEVAAAKSSTALGGYHSECYAYGGGSGLSTACLTFMLVSGETAYYWAKYANATSNRIDQDTITFSNDSTA